MSNTFSISYCIGIYNEEQILEKSITKLVNNLDKILGEKNYEIILVNNGSTDNTSLILSSKTFKNVRWLYIQEKGHGLALKKAVLAAKKKYAVITAIDIPFGFNDLIQAKTLLENEYDIVFGSKAHKASKISTKIERKIASKIYKFMLKILFQLPIDDPQGSIFFNREKILPIIKRSRAKNAFFTTQIAIHASKEKMKMIEIPVVMNVKKRKSKYNVLKDGFKMTYTMLDEFIRIHLS